MVRAQLVLSTKPRPSGPRPLSEVELDEDEVLIDAFSATLGGESDRRAGAHVRLRRSRR